MIAAGRTTVIVPVGGTEQSGAHIGLGKHNARVRELAVRIAERLGNTLVAPVVSYVPQGTIDPPTGHMRFTGTITIPEDVFEKVLESTARSLLHHGFRNVIFLGDHGGYRRSLDRVAARVPGVHALPEYYREMQHAGMEDTALSLALTPDLVRTELIGKARAGKEGVAGDPSGATASLGAELAEQIVQRSAEAIRKAVRNR